MLGEVGDGRDEEFDHVLVVVVVEGEHVFIFPVEQCHADVTVRAGRVEPAGDLLVPMDQFLGAGVIRAALS